MIYRGTVKGNVVMLGMKADSPTAHTFTSKWRIGEQAIETGIRDLATNADHYLYGHPKIIHAG